MPYLVSVSSDEEDVGVWSDTRDVIGDTRQNSCLTLVEPGVGELVPVARWVDIEPNESVVALNIFNASQALHEAESFCIMGTRWRWDTLQVEKDKINTCVVVRRQEQTYHQPIVEGPNEPNQEGRGTMILAEHNSVTAGWSRVAEKT